MELRRTVKMPGGAVLLRPLGPDDLGRGIFELLAQLTKAPPLPQSEFEALVSAFDANPDRLIVVAEDELKHGSLLGTASVLIEQKLIRGGGCVAHIEDVVVDAAARGRSIGKVLVRYLVDFARDRGCYKIILDCTDDNITFYEHCGFHKKEVQMACYF